MRSQMLCACGAVVALVLNATAGASIQFSGAGINPEAGEIGSGTATFSVSGNILTLVLQNTTSPRSDQQGNAMTGVAFNISGSSPTLALTGVALTAGSSIWTSETASNTINPLWGSWTNVLGSSPLASYGVATTGFSGRFHGGSITLGNASPNYGIVAANTFNGTNVVFGGSQFPFIQDSLTFTFTGVSGINESQFADVKLLFGTNGTGIVPADPPPSHSPEPTTFLIWATLATCFMVQRTSRTDTAR
jgi:hypothetical protein